MTNSPRTELTLWLISVCLKAASLRDNRNVYKATKQETNDVYQGFLWECFSPLLLHFSHLFYKPQRAAFTSVAFRSFTRKRNECFFFYPCFVKQ